MATANYSEEQLQVLTENMPKVMRALRDGNGVAEVFSTLDDYCWHVPPCAEGEECVAGEPNLAMREDEEAARNWHIRRDERNGRHTP